MKLHVLSRKWHKHIAILTAAPFLLVLLTGILLQVKKQVAWVQPATLRGSSQVPTLSFDTLLRTVREQAPQAEVQSWADIDRLDVRPKDGTIKVLSKNRYEIQLDFQTAHVLQVEYRRSDVIESLHDGSFFSDAVKLYIFLPVALLLLMVWVSGIHLWLYPKWMKWRRSRHSVAASQTA